MVALYVMGALCLVVYPYITISFLYLFSLYTWYTTRTSMVLVIKKMARQAQLFALPWWQYFGQIVPLSLCFVVAARLRCRRAVVLPACCRAVVLPDQSIWTFVRMYSVRTYALVEKL